jgi:DNA topoisomerase-2
MQEREEPKIVKYTDSDFTRVTFEPDLKRFNMQKLDQDIVDLMKKRVYDIAGVLGGRVKVYLDGKRIEVASFAEYCELYFDVGAE